MADTKISDLAAVTDVLSTDEYVLARAGASKKIDASDLLDGELAYAEITSPVAVSGTEGSPNDVVSSGAISYAAERVRIEFYAPILEAGATASSYVLCNLWDDTTDLGRLVAVGHSALSFLPQGPCYGVRYLTPTAATHTYKVRAWRSVSNGTVHAGAGGVGTLLPAYIRVSRA